MRKTVWIIFTRPGTPVLIEHTGRSEQQYVADLEKLISGRHLPLGADGTPETRANQSFHLAQTVWLKDGGAVDEASFGKNIGSLNKRMALAGLRLGKYEPNLGELASRSFEVQAANQWYSIK